MDMESLLLPISESNPCGKYLCYEHVYDELKELRREDDIRLSQGVWQTEPKRANWPEVNRLCCKLLTTQTKDLQIAMWLMESLIAENRFKGLNEGLKLIKGLCEKFWDDIYPAIDWENHSYSYRMAPFFFLADKIPEKIVLIPLTDFENVVVYSLADWMTARRNLQIKDTKGLSLQVIGKRVAETSLEKFREISEQVDEAIGHMNDIKSFLNEKCPEESPSFKLMLDDLEDIKRITTKNIGIKEKQQEQKRKPEVVQTPIDDNISAEETSDSERKEPTLGQAYNALNEIAAFLQEKQPQSPASTLVKIAWQIGQKSFRELLEMNMKSGTSVLGTISELYTIFYQKPEKHDEK